MLFNCSGGSSSCAVHSIPADPLVMLRAVTHLENLTERGVVPFVIDRENGIASVGYAANRFVVDTFRWLIQQVPEPYFSRMLGLLLGYSASAIFAFESEESVRWFTPPGT